jgi:hypothetical protein
MCPWLDHGRVPKKAKDLAAINASVGVRARMPLMVAQTPPRVEKRSGQQMDRWTPLSIYIGLWLGVGCPHESKRTTSIYFLRP